MNIIIKQLTPELINDFLYYFDEIGFSNNPDWSDCYCYFHHFPGTNQEWRKSSKKQNREAAKNLILTGKLTGFLAYDNNTPIGWINVDLKENYINLPIKDKDMNKTKEEKTASIVCFLIAPTYRRKGVARKLLQESIILLKNEGIKIVESYPRKEEVSDTHSYHGPNSLYKAEGFTVVKELENMYVMQKKIG